ncbi:hypothetical protein FGB62_4g334 [Gracilaria domingensis]|nr:hypothetical protein FGB62_4g334 [Gracilaria domingensis]
MSRQFLCAALDERRTSLCRTIILLLIWGLLTTRASGQICQPPDDADFKREPTFWCQLHANINITRGCRTHVEEIIEPPWSAGRLVRYVPHQANQFISDVQATEFKNGVLKDVASAELTPDSSGTNTAITLRISTSEQPLLIRLHYVVVRGVEFYQPCDVTKDEFEDEEGVTYQIVKWSPGGKSAQYVRSLQATFSLHYSAEMTYNDSPVKKTSDFQIRSLTNTSIAFHKIQVTHGGNATNIKPATTVFYFRGIAPTGSAECPNSRTCAREVDMLREKFKGDGLRKAVIGAGIGIGVLAVIVAIAMWVACCKSLTKKKTGNMDNLPISLRHFAYDTGDDKPSGQLRQWARGKNNVGKKEYLAIELSPGNKQESSDLQRPEDGARSRV